MPKRRNDDDEEWRPYPKKRASQRRRRPLGPPQPPKKRGRSATPAARPAKRRAGPAAAHSSAAAAQASPATSPATPSSSPAAPPPARTPYALNRPQRNRVAPLRHWLGEHQKTRILPDGSLRVTNVRVVEQPRQKRRRWVDIHPSPPDSPAPWWALEDDSIAWDWTDHGSYRIKSKPPGCGRIQLHPSGKKPQAGPPHDGPVFCFDVLEGLVEVTYHSTDPSDVSPDGTSRPIRRLRLERGSSFDVPPGCSYSLKNRSWSRNARLSYCIKTSF